MTASTQILTTTESSEQERKLRSGAVELFKKCPIPESELLGNLPLFIKRQDLSRLLFFHELYKRALHVHGVVMEFGVRWGRDLALFESFRGIYEPCNHNRRIIGFDTFEGFPSVHEKDGSASIAQAGAYSVSAGYEEYLEQVLSYHEHESPISHIKKFQLVKGDAVEGLERYLAEHPETIIALAYFDLDIYEPTKRCLELMKNHITKGTVIGFDELNLHYFPGETLALKEVFGLDRFAIQRSPYSSGQSYIVID